MIPGVTIGVLSPFLGGPYFGGIIAGLARCSRRDGGRVIGIQTLEAGAASADRPGPPPYRHPAALQHIAGFVVIIEAVSPAYLHAVRAAGKPVVVIGHEYPDVPCPVVLSDNASGVRQTVEHLIEHGHRRIAFTGYLGAHDIMARYRAYRAALEANGIEPDPALCYEASDNLESGVLHAAQRMILAGVPFTAVVTGTDVNAIGLIRILAKAGYSVPERVAVVGFDDMPEATFCEPSLTSVNQSFDRLGTSAYELLLARLRGGGTVENGRHLVPTSLIIRESCGCSGMLGQSTGITNTTRRKLAERLAPIFDPSGELSREHLFEIADIMAGVVESAADGVEVQVPTALQAALNRLPCGITARANLEQISEAVRQFATRVTAERSLPTGWLAVEQAIHAIIVKLAQARARVQFQQSTHHQEAVASQYVVSMDLLRSHEMDPRTLEWLTPTRAHGGCLGLWTSSGDQESFGELGDLAGSHRATPAGPVRPGVPPCGARQVAAGPRADGTQKPDEPALQDTTVDIVGTFVRSSPGFSVSALSMPVTSFPPEEIIKLADATEGANVLLAPVKSDTSDWGMLATVGAIECDVQTGREAVNQWSALLTVALQHEAVLKSLRRQEDRLRRVALYDELTGLPNRVLFVDRLRLAISRVKRSPDRQFAVLFLDIDGFKVINDSLGHSAGDRILTQISERIKHNLRQVDTAARFGGDEYLILLEDMASLDAPSEVAERLHASLARPFQLEGHDVVLSASIGIALGNSGYNDPEEVLRDADIAMHTAKSREKGSHAIFDVEMHTRAMNRLRLEAELHRAIERTELQAYYQPIVDLKSGRVAAFEALIRWRHPQRGLIPPGEFLPVAEENGLTLPIGRWMLNEACGQLRAWRSAGIADEHLKMSVNLSNRQFWHGGLLEDIDDCLRETEIDPHCLALEITEGVIMHNVDLACKLLGELHGRGLELHIDDFGTAYSSLEALHQLPIDVLKIDRSFVVRLGTDRRSAELVRTIVLMGRNLGLELIAEGVETGAHQAHLQRLGASYGQGFWFSRPVPGDKAGALIPGTLPHIT